MTTSAAAPVSLITGANKGIGLETIRRAAAPGGRRGVCPARRHLGRVGPASR